MILDMIEITIFTVCVTFSVAYTTVAERKTTGYTQRRTGPNAVGYYGTTQAFADAVKTTVKEIITPKESNKYITVISPTITLITATIGWVVIPTGPAITTGDMENGITFSTAIGSTGVFGVTTSGWSSNSKYSFMGSIRSTAQTISYETVTTTIYIICIMFVSTTNMTTFIETQRIVWTFVPTFPTFIIFFISTVAETNRPPFDTVEAESETVAGFFTEYSGSPFVFFFTAEYSNTITMCASTTITFTGGYTNISVTNDTFTFPTNGVQYSTPYNTAEGATYGIATAVKTIMTMFTFIWVRASFPRFTYDNTINTCWTVFTPTTFGFTTFIPCVTYIFNAFSYV
uniref:NADH-ubiquinone oxidoreductase chain 1 n=1 Tax=Magnusiomyces tetraspermus TaxID=1232584 RepID=A0A023UMA7_9ASCO|nr:NADH dehydrogenase subunit 1 [Magnusiomyces tetraspermus]AHY04934.1 NADH dehydrogenase subunit 1 [Magnusiomyces tetraspermus]